MKTALLIGGSGPTGPHIAEGLSRMGYTVTLLHRGNHEIPELAAYRHVHVDPHFEESLADGLGTETFDVVVATYGRLLAIAAVLAGRCDQLVAVTGGPAYQGWFGPHHLPPHGMEIAVRETGAVVDSATEGDDPQLRLQFKIHRAEQALLDATSRGDYRACIFRYPHLYGPRQRFSFEWNVMKHVIDARPHMVLPEGGLALYTRCFTQNAARAILLAIAQPDASAAEIFNCGDSQQYSVRQWAEAILAHLGSSMRLVSLPDDLATCLHPQWGPTSHCFVDTHKAASTLGYVDKVPALDALEHTLDWYDANRPEDSGNEPEFNYHYEDLVIERYDELVKRMQQEAVFTLPVFRHPYDHPKMPDELLDYYGS
jgi:nucleoside-diphosphate-sugar epimerase